MATLSRPSIAVVGAAGHTGRFVVAELQRRGLQPVGIVRDLAAQSARALAASGAPIRSVALDDGRALREALSGAMAVINCAGPFLDTAEAVASAAVDVRIHYLDVTAEQASAAATLDRFDGPAKSAGVLVLPSMAFYGGLSDLLATAAAGDWAEVDEIEVGLALDSWRPTPGTRATGARNTAPRVIVADGALAPAPQPPLEKAWSFLPPFDQQDVVTIAFTEIVLMARHLQARRIQTWINRTPLRDLSDPSTPPPEPSDASGRSSQVFQVDIRVRRGDRLRRATAWGRDIYGITAPFVCEAVARLLRGEVPDVGARAPGAVFEARSYLAALAPDLTCAFEDF